MGSKPIGFFHNIKMGALKLCLILLFCVLQYHGSAAECVDKYEECDRMAARGGCKEAGEWGDFVTGSCAKSCGICSAPRYTSHDFYGKLATKEGNCHPTRTIDFDANPELKAECEATPCGTCNGVTKLRDDCRDECAENCKAGKEAGLCADKTSYIYQNCPESCGWYKECLCKDTCEECQQWAKDGDCDKSYVVEKCHLSCRDPICFCEDTCAEACKDWAKDGLCDKEPWVDAHCANSCKWDNCTAATTPAPTTTVPTTTIDCRDRCPELCAVWPCSDPDVARECPGTCDERCNPDPTDAPDSCSCGDGQYGQCGIDGACTKWCHVSNWVGVVKDCADCSPEQDPLCSKYGKLLFDPDTKQCGWPRDVVPKRSDCSAVSVSAKRASDGFADCEFWAANGDCNWSSNCGTCDWQAWVCDNCPFSCAGTNCHYKPPHPNGEDEYADCKFWAANGDCDTGSNCGTCDWQKWVAAHCKGSCK